MNENLREPSTSPRLLVIEPDPKALLDDFEMWLTEYGVRITTIRPHAGEDVPTELIDVDAVLVLGGSMSSLDDLDYPWLEQIRELLRNAHDTGRPALGICLGAQLMAQAHGGSVSVGANGLEGGLITVRWRDEAGGDALLGGLADPFAVGALHGDAIEVLPPSASWLARNDRYPHQAFRLGATSWGLQFHPEVSAATMGMWVSYMEDEHGGQLAQLRSSAELFHRQYAEVQSGTATLARRFARLISFSVE
ncbi:type 1 glutamine amidotransferase [soil metagenome]